MAIDVKKVLQTKMNFAWLVKYANPKMRKFFDSVKHWWVVTFDWEKIVSQLENARMKVAKYLKDDNKKILIVNQQTLYADDIKGISKKYKNVSYMTYKVPAWFLTNFDTLIKTVNKMNELRDFINSDKFVRLTKREKSHIKREFSKIERIYGWVSNLSSLPDLVIVINGWQMKSFVKELEITGIDNIILASANFDKWWDEDCLLCVNVDSYTSVTTTLNYIFGMDK